MDVLRNVGAVIKVAMEATEAKIATKAIFSATGYIAIEATVIQALMKVEVALEATLIAIDNCGGRYQGTNRNGGVC